MNIWRVQTNTSRGDISQYCIDNHIIAMGWSLLEYNGNNNELVFNSFDEYYEVAKDYYDNLENLNRMANYLSENDIIWMRCKGLYYCARVTKDSKWVFNNSQEARDRDACNQFTNINWIKIGDETVPGALSTAFIRGKVLQNIYKSGILEYSMIAYNENSQDSFRYDVDISLTQDVFYNLMSPSDCEDLLYMWLFKKHNKNYVCIPSTNKLSTEKYEFVIIDVESGKHIYIQVKKGNVDLDANDYIGLVENTENEVYLLTTEGNTHNSGKYKNIHFVSPKELFEFACEEDNTNYIPPNVDFWMQFAGGYKGAGIKGIMIDTNTQEDEQYMLENNVIAAWGSPKKYINAFNKNDYALYYRKRYGVIAIGKIISDVSESIENGLQHHVDMVINPSYNKNLEPISIYPYEIKALLNKGFYFASTRKVPFLDNEEVNILINELKKKQEL